MKYYRPLGARLAGPFFASRPGRAGALLLAAGLALLAPLQARALELSLESRRHSDPLPLSRIGDDDDIARLTPRPGRNLIYLRDELRVSAPWAGGRLSALVRQSATLVANQEALALAAEIETPDAPPLNVSAPVQARYTGFTGGGLAWSRSSSSPPGGSGWQWEAGAQALMLHRLQWRQIHGHADVDAAARRYGVDLSYGRADPKLGYPFQPQEVADHGYALLLQGALRWCGEALCLHAGVEDLGRLFWPRLVREDAALSSQIAQRDADGYLVYKPLVQGRYRQGTWQQSAPATLQWRAQWRFAPGWRTELHADRLQGFGMLPSAHLRWQPRDIEWSASWRAHERQFGLQARGSGWQLGFAADRLGGLARSRAIQAALVWPWP